MRVLGGALLAAGCVLVGQGASARLRQSCRRLDTLVQFILALGAELRYTQAPPAQLFTALATRSDFVEFEFLHAAVRLLGAGQGFPEAVRQAADELADCTDGERELLLLIGQLLGRSDLQGQLSRLSSLELRAQALAGAALQQREQYTKVYNSIGLGCAAAIMIMLL